jgi:hypothetical protein
VPSRSAAYSLEYTDIACMTRSRRCNVIRGHCRSGLFRSLCNNHHHHSGYLSPRKNATDRQTGMAAHTASLLTPERIIIVIVSGTTVLENQPWPLLEDSQQSPLYRVRLSASRPTRNLEDQASVCIHPDTGQLGYLGIAISRTHLRGPLRGIIIIIVSLTQQC